MGLVSKKAMFACRTVCVMVSWSRWDALSVKKKDARDHSTDAMMTETPKLRTVAMWVKVCWEEGINAHWPMIAMVASTVHWVTGNRMRTEIAMERPPMALP